MSRTPQVGMDAPADPSVGFPLLFQTPDGGYGPASPVAGSASGVGANAFATPFTRVPQGWRGRQTVETSFRHGSAAPGSAQRIRTPRGRGRGETRNRGNSGISPVSASGQRDDYSPRRDEPSGPEEANHWGTALIQVAEAIQTIEGNQRLHATEIAIGASRISELQSQVDSSIAASDTAIAASNKKLDEVENHSLQTRAFLQEMSVNIFPKYATLE